jgi:hypothetical protein
MGLPSVQDGPAWQVPSSGRDARAGRVASLTRLVVFLVVFNGGFAVMAVEIVGGRILAPHFGGSIHVWGSLISVFMLALSLGYLLGGRLSLRQPSLAGLGTILMISAATVAPIIWLGESILERVFAQVADPRYGSLIASAALFAVPTAVMGTISPYAVRLLAQDTNRSGHIAGKLYCASTAGSATGTLLTAFFLVLWLETPAILGTIVLALLACGLLARVTPALPSWRQDR